MGVQKTCWLPDIQAVTFELGVAAELVAFVPSDISACCQDEIDKPRPRSLALLKTEYAGRFTGLGKRPSTACQACLNPSTLEDVASELVPRALSFGAENHIAEILRSLNQLAHHSRQIDGVGWRKAPGLRLH